MPYHVRISRKGDDWHDEVKLDLLQTQLEKQFVEPYKQGRPIVVNGVTIPIDELERIAIFHSDQDSSVLLRVVEDEQRRSNVISFGGPSNAWRAAGKGENVSDQFIVGPPGGSAGTAVEVPGLSTVLLICDRFPVYARQIGTRQRGRDGMVVNDEYDVQDLLHAALRLHFEDVRPEEWSPSYAGKSSRMDFLLPELEVVIETKMTRDSLPTGKLGEELLVDIAHYAQRDDVSELICLVYDPEHKVANPRGLERDLERQSSPKLRVSVIVAS